MMSYQRLSRSLEQALKLINVGGRISVITFQSLEDRLVKTMFKEVSSVQDVPRGLPVIPASTQPNYRPSKSKTDFTKVKRSLR